MDNYNIYTYMYIYNKNINTYHMYNMISHIYIFVQEA
jgi:hypothetical protein